MYIIDELWIKKNHFVFTSFCRCIEAILMKNFFFNRRTCVLFVYREVICRNKIVYNWWTLDEKKKNQPLFRGCFLERCSLSIFYIIVWVHWSNSAEKLFLQSTNFEFYKKLNAFNPPQGMFRRSKVVDNFFYYFVCIEKLFGEIKLHIIDTLWKKINDFNPSLGDVPEVGADCQFFTLFCRYVEAILPKIFFVIDELGILKKIKRFQPRFKGCFEDPKRLIIFCITSCVSRSNLTK